MFLKMLTGFLRHIRDKKDVFKIKILMKKVKSSNKHEKISLIPTLWVIRDPFHATDLFPYHRKQKTRGFLMFSGVSKETSGMD